MKTAISSDTGKLFSKWSDERKMAMSSGVRTQAVPTAGVDRTIIQAAFDLISADGFDAMSMRALAKSVGLHPGSLYYHFPSKHDLLGDLLTELLQARLDGWLAAKPNTDDPEVLLIAFIQFHAERQRSCFREEALLNSEMRKLQGGLLRQSQAITARYFDELVGILRLGVDRSVFHVSDAHLVSRSLIAMLGSATATDTDLHNRVLIQLSLRMLGVEHNPKVQMRNVK